MVKFKWLLVIVVVIVWIVVVWVFGRFMVFSGVLVSVCGVGN